MEVSQIDFPDVWCEEESKIRPKAIPHCRLVSDHLVSNILKEGYLIGFGRFGKVYQMEDMKTRKLFAVKTMKRVVQESGSRIIRKIIEREISILRLCNHPNVIDLFKTIETPETVYLLLELFEKSVFEIIQLQGILTECETRIVTQAMSSALTYLHSKEIAHRDLKLTNILCNSDPTNPRDLFWSVKLSDFGLAACRGPPGTTKLFSCSCGTPNFMAPEILMRDPYDTKCDIWSFGVVLYWCLIGQAPFPGETEPEVKRQISIFEIKFDDEIWIKFSRRVQTLLKMMLIVDPLTRFSAFQVKVNDWTQGKETATSTQNSDELTFRQNHSRRPKSSRSVVTRVKKCLDDLLSETQRLEKF